MPVSQVTRSSRSPLTLTAPPPAWKATPRASKKTNGPLTGRGSFSSSSKRKRPAPEQEFESDIEPAEDDTQLEVTSTPSKIKKEDGTIVKIKKEGNRKVKPKIQPPKITQIVGIDNGMSGSGR